jgi:hypothetical protein
MPDSHPWGSEERLPKFVVIKIPTATVAQVENYIQPWRRTVDYTLDSSDLVTDTHTITIRAVTGVSASLKGIITRAQVESFLTRWGATVQSVASNAVTFTIRIFTAICSTAFWSSDRAALTTFVEQSYTQVGGIHRVQCDYSTLGISAEAVVRLITERLGTIISHDEVAHVAVFEVARADVRTQFQADVKRHLDGTVGRRQWRFNTATMDAAEAAGGELTLTIAQAQAALIDQLTE